MSIGSPAAIRLDDLPRAFRERYVGSGGEFLVRAFAADDLWQFDKLDRFTAVATTVDAEATAEIHVAYKGGCLFLDGHAVAVTFGTAFGKPKPCRPQFNCPACSRRCARLYRTREAFFPWRCVGCANLEYRAQHLKPFERAERRYGRLAAQGRERKRYERHKQYWWRVVAINQFGSSRSTWHSFRVQ